MNCATFGSCLSSLTATRLEVEYGFSRICNISHNRSDAFVNNFIAKETPQYNLVDLEKSITFKNEHEVIAKKILLNQSINSIGKYELPVNKSFFDLESDEVDVFLLDNFMDISAKLISDKDNDGFPFFMNIGFAEKGLENFKFGDFLDPIDSVNNWIKIIKFLKDLHPNAKFVFLSFQYNVLVDKPDRFKSAKEFNMKMNEALAGSDVLFIPSLIPDSSLTKGKSDWTHFSNQIYKALAALVFLHLNVKTEIPLKSIFDHFDESKWIDYDESLSNLCICD